MMNGHDMVFFLVNGGSHGRPTRAGRVEGHGALPEVTMTIPYLSHPASIKQH